MARINIGFIGLGRIADVHYPGYSGGKGARLYSICDSDEQWLAKRREEWGVKVVYRDYREMLADPQLDAVEILTPQRMHEQMATEALQAGKHVALQKPMSIDLASADRILAAAQAEPKLVFRVTDNYVFYPPLIKARELIDSGAIGEPTNLRIRFVSGGSGGWEIPPTAWQWRLQESREGRGMQIFDHGHHLWASAWYLLGDIERVSAWIDSVDGIIDSPATIMWKYAKQMCYGVCEYTHAPQLHIPSDYYANDEWWEIAGTAGILRVNRCTGKLNEGPSLSLFQGKKWKHYGNLKADWVEGFKNATKNFVDAIHGKSEPVLNGKQARDIMRFALAIGRAARERREVYIEEMEYGPSRGRRFSQKKIKAARRKQKQDRPSWLERMGITQDLSKYAPRARDLTYDLLQKFDPEKVADWRAEVGLFLTAEGEAAEQKFVLRIGDSQASLDEGDIPSRASLVIEASPGAWAAVLLKKKRLETAFLQGKIKIVKGKAEDALKLRAAFQL